jgi:putative membrane protein
MLRQMLIVSSGYLIGYSTEFTGLVMYILAYVSILIVLSVVLFHEPKSREGLIEE